MSAFCTYICCVCVVAVNIKNVHFKHVCLFISDLLLMSDCFHVSCALHFDIVSSDQCHGYITQKEWKKKYNVLLFSFLLRTKFNPPLEESHRRRRTSHSFFVQTHVLFVSVFFFGPGNKNCNIKTNKD